MLEPTYTDFTVKVAWPAAFVVPLTVVIVSERGREEAIVTTLPATGLPTPSLSVTTSVEKDEPSACTEVGDATSVEFATFAPVKPIVAVEGLIMIESVTSVAV